MVEDGALIRSLEPPRLNPGVGEPAFAFTTEEEQPADGGKLPPLVVGSEAERRQVAAMQRAHRSERLGSGSEVEGFRVGIGHWLFIEGFAADEAPEFLNQLCIGAAVGRADAHVGAAVCAFLGEMVGARRARMHLERDHVGTAPGQDLDVGDKARRNRIADQAGEAFLQLEGLGDASHTHSIVSAKCSARDRCVSFWCVSAARSCLCR